jgi:hypothetical protein
MSRARILRYGERPPEVVATSHPLPRVCRQPRRRCIWPKSKVIIRTVSGHRVLPMQFPNPPCAYAMQMFKPRFSSLLGLLVPPLFIPLSSLEHLQVSCLLRQKLLRLCGQTTTALVLDLVLRDDRRFLRLDDAGAWLGTCAGWSLKPCQQVVARHIKRVEDRMQKVAGACEDCPAGRRLTFLPLRTWTLVLLRLEPLRLCGWQGCPNDCWICDRVRGEWVR